MDRNLLTGIIVVILGIVIWISYANWAQKDTAAYCARHGQVCPNP